MFNSRHSGRRLAIVAVSAIGLALGACGGGDDDGDASNVSAEVTAQAEGNADSDGTGVARSTDTSESATPDAEVDTESTLRLLAYQPLPIWDPHLQSHSATAAPPYTYVYDQLVRLQPGNVVGPMLATEWTLSDDRLHQEFTLRDDVTFDDGTPLDAAAVKANLDRARTIEGSTVAGPLSAVESVDIVDPTTIAVTFSEPTGNFPQILAGDLRISSIVNPAAFDQPDALAQKPDGTGPYSLAEQDDVSRVLFERKASYWDPGVAQVHAIEWTVIEDDPARLAAFQSGQGDIMTIGQGPTAVSAEQLAEAEPDTYTFFGGYVLPQNIGIMVNTEMAPLDDEVVRKAITLAVDRDAFRIVFAEGAGVSTRQMFHDGFPGFIPESDAEALAPRPDEAQALLEEAGLNEVSFALTVPALPSYQAGAQVIQQNLAAAGIDVTLNVVAAAEVRPNFRSGAYQSALLGQTPTIDSVGTMRFDLVTNEGVGPVPEYLQTFVDDIQNASTADEREPLLQEFNEVLLERPVHTYLVADYTQFIVRNNVSISAEQPLISLASVPDLRFATLIKAS